MTLPADPGPEPPRRRSALVRWAPLLAALAVVLVVVGVVAAVRGGGSSGGLPVLNVAGGGDLAVAAAPNDEAGPVVLEGALPTDGPSHAKVYRYADSAAPAGTVRSLARALGLKATPARHGANWQAQGGDSSLTVSDRYGQRWSYEPGRCTIEGDVSSCSSGSAATPAPRASTPVECVKAPCPGPGYTPPSTPPDQPNDLVKPRNPIDPTGPTGTPPDLAAATPVAAAVFRAVGLDPAGASHENLGASGIRFAVSPAVDGRDVADAETWVVVGAGNAITSAGGVLGTAAAGDTYPLVSAKTAYQRLRTAPRPDLCRLDPANGGCANARPTVVTGARPGLMFTVDRDGKALLVPAWLFTVKNGGTPLAALALPDRYLGKPPAKDASGSNQPASSAPGGPPSGVAAPPSTPSVAAPGPVTGGAYPIVSVTASGATLGVSYDGGPGNPCTNPVQPQVQETSTTVTVTVHKAVRKPGMMCPQYVQEGPFVTSVTLKSPLGGRTVVDGSNGAHPKVVTR
ncbi:MAG: hypothetical protein ACJ73S_20455 [Mycobacteriales bacterium]